VLVFLFTEPFRHGRGYGGIGAGRQFGCAQLRQPVGRQGQHRSARGEPGGEGPGQRPGMCLARERQDRDGLEVAPRSRAAAGPVAQADGDAAGKLPDQLGLLAAQAIEGVAIHLQQEAVAHRTQAGGARAAGQQADFADGFPRRHFRNQRLVSLAAVVGGNPDLQPAACQQIQGIPGIALTKEPVAAATGDRLQRVQDRCCVIGGDGEGAFDGQQQ
jgi:hypothetical protein